MNIRHKYWIISLSLLLSFSLVLPFCCHADISKVFSHHQEQSHTLYGHTHNSDASDCGCGHQLGKDFNKPNKVLNASPSKILSATVFSGSLALNNPHQSSPIQRSILTRFDAAGPPLHLLHNVFLN